MSTFTKKKFMILKKVTLNLGCTTCTKPNLSNVFSPKPRTTKSATKYHKQPPSGRRGHHHHHYYSSSLGSLPDTNTTTTFSSEIESTPAAYYSSSSSDTDDIKSLRAVQGFGRIGGESLALEKDSDDPYHDFRQSMLQMILENEIYSKDDLKELLNCFLQLNSPYYHGIIVRAFSEIWNGVFSPAAAPQPYNIHGGVWFSSYQLSWKFPFN